MGGISISMRRVISFPRFLNIPTSLLLLHNIVPVRPNLVAYHQSRVLLCARDPQTHLRRRSSKRRYPYDQEQKFIDLGYDLFADKQTCKGHIFTADIFLKGVPLSEIEGSIDAIYVGSLLHLFDWDDQARISRRIINILTQA